jgi:hypothetical protein
VFWALGFSFGRGQTGCGEDFLTTALQK